VLLAEAVEVLNPLLLGNFIVTHDVTSLLDPMPSPARKETIAGNSN
jgi:hypothetical protein